MPVTTRSRKVKYSSKFALLVQFLSLFIISEYNLDFEYLAIEVPYKYKNKVFSIFIYFSKLNNQKCIWYFSFGNYMKKVSKD